MSRSIAPLRGALPPAPPGPVARIVAHRPGRMAGALILAAMTTLLVLAAVAWTQIPTLYVREHGTRQADPPRAADVRHDLRRVALRLSEPVTIRRR